MSGRASNQVNNLRALFEPNNNSDSPPSRARSPAGPETLKGSESRPVSKIRTSFIAVERSGPMAPAVGLKKTNDEEHNKSGQSGGSEPPPVANGTLDQSPGLNGEKTVSPTSSKSGTGKVDEEKEPEQPNSAEASSLDQSQTSPSKNADAKKAGSFAETKPDKRNSAAIPEPIDNLETSKQSDQPQGLGDILKGAPFVNEVPENSEASGAHAAGIPESKPSPPKQKAAPRASLPNGQPKRRSSYKTPSPPKPQSGSSRPPAIDTQKGNASESAKTSAVSPTNAKKSPRTPGSPDVTSRQPPPKTESPRQPIPSKNSNDGEKEIRKAPIPKQTQAAAGAKAPSVPASKHRQASHSSTTNPVKKAGPSSPTLKTRPKSPTRQVRLPAAATAATASSAAKTGEAPPLRPPSRTGAAAGPKPSAPNRGQPGGASREGTTNASSSLRKSSSRPSLPAATKSTQKPKARTSTASLKASEGSFLARMMRPTQSSASKVHEKIEHAAASAKSNTSKPKRKSGGSDERGQGPDEAPPSSTTQQQDEQQTPSPTSANGQEGETINGTEAEPATSKALEG